MADPVVREGWWRDDVDQHDPIDGAFPGFAVPQRSPHEQLPGQALAEKSRAAGDDDVHVTDASGQFTVAGLQPSLMDFPRRLPAVALAKAGRPVCERATAGKPACRSQLPAASLE
jgi:hypothetical protein